MDLCFVNCKESRKTLILCTCMPVDVNVTVIGRVRVIKSPPLGPCELDLISNFHQNTSYQTLKVLLSLDYCAGQFIRFLETINNSFISTRDLRLFSLIVPLLVFRGGRTIRLGHFYHLYQSMLDFFVERVCNLGLVDDSVPLKTEVVNSALFIVLHASFFSLFN